MTDVNTVGCTRRGRGVRLNAHFIPYWPANPYQPMLAAALDKEGICVVQDSRLSSLAQAEGGLDLIHLHWLPSVGLRPRSLLRTLRYLRNLVCLHKEGVPIVWTAHNLIPHESRWPALDLQLSRQVARLADRIICHSSAARDEVVARLIPSNPGKTRVIPHGHYIDSYPNNLAPLLCRERLSLAASDQVFLFLGLIRAYKGVFKLIDAFRRLTSPNARLVIAGRPLDSGIDAQVTARISGDPRIVYRPGFVADADLQLYLNAADAVVFPYHRSLTSGALILAMSYGRACIAPRLPGMVDCLTEHGGVFYDTAQADSLFDALSAATEQRRLLTAMGAMNLERARTWDWGSVARATADCYREAREASRHRTLAAKT